MSKVTVREAAILTGKSRETINNATKGGSISYELNSKNHKVIDVSELERVYPIVNTMEDLKSGNSVKKSQPKSETDSQEWYSKYMEVKNQLEVSEEKIQLIEEHNKQKQILYEDQLDNLKQSLKLAQEGQNKVTLLLEHYNKDTAREDIKVALSELKIKVSNQEKVANDKFEILIQENDKILKEKADIEKANLIYKYAGILFVIILLTVSLYISLEQGIIPFN